MLRTDRWGEAGENSTPTRQLDVLISFSSCRGHHSSQSTTHSWEVLRRAKDYSKTRGGRGRLWSSCVIVWGNYSLMQRMSPSLDPGYCPRNLLLQSLKLRQGIGLKGPLFPSSAPSLACPQYISEYNIQLPNPLGSSHSYKVSPPGLQDAFPN